MAMPGMDIGDDVVVGGIDIGIGVLPQAAVNNPAAATAARARVIVNMGLSFRVT
jgi:hypothetical protein